MRIIAKNKKELQKIIKELREKGYNLITFGYKFSELEKDNEIVSIEVK